MIELFDRRVEDADPLDVRLAGPPLAESRWRLRSRLALGLSPTPRPGLVLLLLGMALGPHGLRVVSPPVLSFLDPAVSLALAALGAFVGLDLRVRRAREHRLLVAASVESGVTLLVVAAGILGVHLLSREPPEPAIWLLAIVLGCCAACSAAPADDVTGGIGSPRSRIGELDDVVPIVIGGLALAAIHAASPTAVLRMVGEAAAVAAIVAAGGWLLVAQTGSDSEQRVFAIGALLLLGGSAAYLSLSALVSGLIAGAVWNAAGGAARDRIERDLRYLQHPLLALLLVVAGASMQPSAALLMLSVIYVVLRVMGKLAGGWLGGRLAGGGLPRGLGFELISPGIIAIAFALNALQVGGDLPAATALGVAVVGSLGSELVALVVTPRERAT
jgi:hypothetical protein